MIIREFFVEGNPATKGSTRSFVSKRTRKVVTISDNQRLEGWENRVYAAARSEDIKVTTGRVDVVVTFFLPRPAYHFGRLGVKATYARAEHLKKPDTDKLLRAVLDGLTGVAYADDAQVVHPNPRKQYTDADAPHRTGALIRVIQHQDDLFIPSPAAR